MPLVAVLLLLLTLPLLTPLLLPFWRLDLPLLLPQLLLRPPLLWLSRQAQADSPADPWTTAPDLPLAQPRGWCEESAPARG